MSRQGRWAAAVVVALLMPLCAVNSRAQEAERPGAGRGQYAGMQRIGGVITAISGPQVTIKTVDGAVYQVVTTDNTRVMRGRGEAIKLTDLKAGDGLMAMGNMDAPNKTMHAAMVISMDAEQMKRIDDARKQELANLGKTLIAGTVTAIDMDNATMTVERPDGVSQTIGFDEGTSFHRGRLMGNGTGFGAGRGTGSGSNATTTAQSGESITLADIKVGDRVGGPGEVKSGRFVAKELTVMTPGNGRRRSTDNKEGSETGTSETGTPENGKPSSTPPPSPK
ncbi:MAG TPA: hypothetical protein VGU25_16710 [Acidobacteriaceae bacterium]|nr:hypothetical protein [Acidobacteriaceae bacterium]